MAGIRLWSGILLFLGFTFFIFQSIMYGKGLCPESNPLRRYLK